MTMHLSDEDVAAAADGTLTGARAAHLDQCATCRNAVAQLSALIAEAKSHPLAEPSPLFWDHFSARVRDATSTERAPSRRIWHVGRPMVVFSAAAVVLVLLGWSALSWRDRSVAVPPPAANMVETGADEEIAWQAVSEMAAAMTADDVRRATAAPVRATVLSELSDVERAAFVELLKQEIGDVQ